MRHLKSLRIVALSFGFMLQTIFMVKAECTYQQLMRAEEFPIGVMLSWSTASENNNSMFLVEKSENGGDFVPAGTVRGAGNSKNEKKYNFLDAQPAGSKVNYRLKQVDFDGSFSYTDVLTINKKIETNVMLVQISSETVNKNFDFTIDALKDGGAIFQLVNGTGQVVWQGTKMLINGLNNITIDLSAQKEGVYKVLVVMDKDEKMLTIRKSFDDVERAANVATKRKTKGKN
jgi:hypothetical protein